MATTKQTIMNASGLFLGAGGQRVPPHGTGHVKNGPDPIPSELDGIPVDLEGMTEGQAVILDGDGNLTPGSAVVGSVVHTLQDAYDDGAAIVTDGDDLDITIGAGDNIVIRNSEGDPVLSQSNTTTQINNDSVSFKDQNLASAVELSEAGEAALETTAQSLVGAINENKGAIAAINADVFLKLTDTSDDIMGGSTNLFTTAAEKSNWFSKSGDDSDNITEGSTNLFMSTTQDSTVNNIIAGELPNSTVFVNSGTHNIVKTEQKILVKYTTTGTVDITFPVALKTDEDWAGVLILDEAKNSSINSISLVESGGSTFATIKWNGGSVFVYSEDSEFVAETRGIKRQLHAVIRQTAASAGWDFLNDSGHNQFGFSGIGIDPVDDYSLVLDHEESIPKIGAILVTPDEWYTKGGVKVGNSVSAPFTKLFAHKDACFTIGNSSLGVLANGFFGSTITAVKNADNTITVTHPTVLSGSDEAVVCPGGVLDEAKQIPVLVSTTATTITFALYAPLSGYVYYDGADWVVSTNAASEITLSVDSTGITMTHTNLSLNAIKMVSARDGDYLAHVDANNATTTRVVFRDYTGAVSDPTVSSTFKRFYFSGTDLVQQKTLFGQTKVFRSNVALKWDNIYGSTGNFWVRGI